MKMVFSRIAASRFALSVRTFNSAKCRLMQKVTFDDIKFPENMSREPSYGYILDDNAISEEDRKMIKDGLDEMFEVICSIYCCLIY